MTTISLISNAEYEASLMSKVGSLMFPDELHNSTSYVDRTKLKKTLGDKLPAGKKIVGVMVHTTESPLFKNILNKAVSYKSPLAAMPTQDGAYYTSKYGIDLYLCDHPVGDVIVVYN
jgi:hypothetical protein